MVPEKKIPRFDENHKRDLCDREETGNSRIVWIARVVVIGLAALCVWYNDVVQKYTNFLWYFLLRCDVFNCVYFETWLATFCYAVIIPVYPYAIHYIKTWDKYKIHPSVTYEHQGKLRILGNAMIYMTPLMILDTFMVKKYDEVDPAIWAKKRESWIQTTRALPVHPPSFYELVFDLIASVVLYDALFFFLHVALHKNFWLYKTFHAQHHNHDVMHAHVTNQLSVGERIALVLSANFALKVFRSHPLTRALFVPVFIWLLVDNHTGYDLPWGLHRIIPFGIMGGPRKHYSHHVEGSRNYEPFMTYLDKLFLKYEKKRVS